MFSPPIPQHPHILILSSSFSKTIWGTSHGAISTNSLECVPSDHMLYIVGWKVFLLVLLTHYSSHSTFFFIYFYVSLVVLLSFGDLFVSLACLPQGIVLE